MPGGGLWDNAFTLLRDTGRNILFDRVYGVLRLVPEHLRVPPDCEISMTELLSRVLSRVASRRFRRRPQNIWIGIYDILKAWKDCVSMMADPLNQSLAKALKMLDPPKAYDDGKRTIAVVLSTQNLSVSVTVIKNCRMWPQRSSNQNLAQTFAFQAVLTPNDSDKNVVPQFELTLSVITISPWLRCPLYELNLRKDGNIEVLRVSFPYTTLRHDSNLTHFEKVMGTG